ncbi:hypothetical protein CTA2_6205 [Colletotrichum tanaceti]|uniref:Uncharacterized protein n=1 Tax=Colletotrichum tanaceti TaxID=1306861 RepID=A0A4U6X2Z1_9PEZI|nr:hypothetical protein CTA2_6205 [Colletotrichum tanaceti]TKW49525.1 hypothetical protein CTA1_7179 [Colletotrichum tanaceti]
MQRPQPNSDFAPIPRLIYGTAWKKSLTANPHLVKGHIVARVAAGAGVSNEVAMYGLVLGLRGVSVLNGTTNEARMREDLEGVEKVAAWAEDDGAEVWKQSLAAFKSVLGDPEGV